MHYRKQQTNGNQQGPEVVCAISRRFPSRLSGFTLDFGRRHPQQLFCWTFPILSPVDVSSAAIFRDAWIRTDQSRAFDGSVLIQA
jgi:hypothetical protein